MKNMLNNFRSFTLQARNDYTLNMMVQKVVIWIPVLQKKYKKGVFDRRNKRVPKYNIHTYSKNKSIERFIADCLISSFSAVSLPIVSSTEMNSTI
jgi:hypothetical protein